MQFSDLGLGSELLSRVAEVGYERPTPIQEQAIPTILQGRDILGCAQTGTGKTASFTLPMIEILASGRSRARMPRSLILEPTRELAAQVANDFDKFGKHHKLSMALLIGGESLSDQVKKLDRGVDVLIATPGRMIDLFERGNVLLSDIRIFVIDEADRMLDMGFIPDIERIVSLLPRIRQTLLFSATMPPEIKRLADAFLANPREITVTPPASPAETVTQMMAVVRGADKRKALRHLLKAEEVKNALIFCNRKRDVMTLFHSLERHGFDVAAMHGDMPQSKRTQTLEAFKSGGISLLVCSDVAARGLDIAGLSHVFNFDVPINPEDYVHRIGRTGRAGRSGRAFTLVTSSEAKQVGAISRLINREIPRVTLDGFEPPAADDEAEETRRPLKGRAKSRERDGDRPRGRRDADQGDRGRPERMTSATETAAEPPAIVDRDPLPVIERRPRATRPVRATEEPMWRRGGPDRSPIIERSATPQPDRDDVETEARRSRPSRSVGEEPAWRRGRRNGDDDDAPVLGFGDHIPAFVLRPARPASTQD